METAQQKCLICGEIFFEAAGSLSGHCPVCQSAQTKHDSNVVGHPKHLAPDTTPLDENGTPSDSSANTTAIENMPETIDDVRPSSSATLPDVDGTAQGRTKFGRFRILSVLGRGAFGTVYQAYDPLLDREVAVKVPRFGPDEPKMVERFHREAKSAARLHHPNIVTLFENGQTDDGPYLVSEYVDGVTLSQIIRKKQYDIRTAVDWVRQISEAIFYAHSEGIVHRDIKPGNIMVNQVGRPQIMDFGLAKRDVDADSNVTVEGQILGTPNYMSPEQALGMNAAIGAHSDQYSVGVVLYELLCGCTPFSGQPLVVMTRVGNWKDLPPTPRSVRPEIPRDLEACCLKAIEKDSKSRYPDLKALADDLDRWLKGLPLVARPIGPVEQLVRWYHKNRLIASLTGTLATLLLLMAIIGPWLAIRFQSLADSAHREASDAKTARAQEQAARLDAERILIDNYTESGLTAERNGDPREAVLWFGNAVAAAANHPDRERHNRIRLQSWLPKFAAPIHAFLHAASWNKGLTFHPGGQGLLSVPISGEAEWLDLSTGTGHSIPLPRPITAAIWSPDGTRLVAASNRIVAFFEHPSKKESDGEKDGEKGSDPLTARGSDPFSPSDPFFPSELERWESPDPVNCLQFSPNGELLFLGGHQSIQIYDFSKKALRATPLQIGSRVHAIEVSPDSRRFAVRSEDQRVRVFTAVPHSDNDQSSTEPILPPQPSASEGEVLPFFVANDRLIVVDNQEGFVCCWDLDNRNIVWKHGVKRILSMALSPNRQWLALGDNFDAILLDVTVAQPFKARITHRNLVHGLGFHPQSHLLLTASNDHSVQMFDVESGRPACAPIPHNTAAHRCVWSPDGSMFATVNWHGELVRVWKPGQSAPSEIASAPSATGPFVRFNFEGDRWLPSGFDGARDRVALEIIDVKTGQAIGPKLTGPGLISDADFVRRSPLVVLVGGGVLDETRRIFREQSPESPGFIRFVNSNSGQPAFPDIPAPSQPIAVKVSSDGATAVVLCHRGQILLLDVATQKVRSTATAFGGQEATHGFVIRDRIRISPDDDLFAVWGCVEEAQVYSLKTGERQYVLRHAKDFIHDVQFSPDGRTVATCGSDHTARLWSAASGSSLVAPLQHPGWIFSAQFNKDGTRLLTACGDRHARLWDVSTGTSILATHEQPDQVFGVCFLPDDQFFLVSDRSGQITGWETGLGKMIAPARHMPNMVYQLSLSGPGTDVIAAGRIIPSRAFRWRDWIVDRDLSLDREDTLVLGEILSGRQIHGGGAVTHLTSTEWMARWQRFHTRHSLRSIVDAGINRQLTNEY